MEQEPLTLPEHLTSSPVFRTFVLLNLQFSVQFFVDNCCPFVVSIMAIVFSVLRITPSDYPFGILWQQYFLSFALRLLITHLVSCGHCIFCPPHYAFLLPLWYLLAIAFSVLRITPSDYPFGILQPLHFLSFTLRLLITHLVSCGHCIFCPPHYAF